MSDPPFAPFDLQPVAPPRGAVLLLHGFTGSPWDLRPLGEALRAAGYRAACPLLPGHGDAAGELTAVGEAEWEQCAEGALRSLAAEAHGPVHVVGFSMGALLAVVLGANHRARVRSVTLLAPAFRLADGRTGWLRRLRMLPFERLKPWMTKDGTDIRDEAVRAGAPLMPRWPLAWLRGFWTLQDRARELAPLVRAPSLVIAADRDAVVSLDGAREAARLLPTAPRLVRLPHSGHVIPRDHDRARATEELLSFLARC